jgi:hypothetical protein
MFLKFIRDWGSKQNKKFCTGEGESRELSIVSAVGQAFRPCPPSTTPWME